MFPSFATLLSLVVALIVGNVPSKTITLFVPGFPGGQVVLVQRGQLKAGPEVKRVIIRNE